MFKNEEGSTSYMPFDYYKIPKGIEQKKEITKKEISLLTAVVDRAFC